MSRGVEATTAGTSSSQGVSFVIRRAVMSEPRWSPHNPLHFAVVLRRCESFSARRSPHVQRCRVKTLSHTVFMAFEVRSVFLHVLASLASAL